ncbi:unnamed protein product [Urochloa decumbens]|uniref:Protein FAR1-RELATED SEQUENCE n=1 Tax=Urochloa decumbens TaxID=240449 RepID=A0ABC9E1Y1_9POAL
MLLAPVNSATSSATRPAPTPPPMVLVAPVLPTTAAAAPSTPVAVVVGSDPLHHTTNLTPPAPVPEGSMQTPVAPQIFFHDPYMNPAFVPRVQQQFHSMVDAYEFYKDYAKTAGFSLRTARTSKETAHWVCWRGGHHKSKKAEEDKVTEKGSKRCGCEAYVKVKQDAKQGVWFFDHVQLAHNHKLESSPRMVRYMHAHKYLDDGMCDIFNIMIANGVNHQPALHVMAHLYGDRQKWGFTEKDIENKKSEYARSERDDDLNKLLQFFRECKKNNDHFYWDVDADPKTGVLKNIFWCHASQRAQYKDFGDAVTFDTTYKTNYKHMPLAMFVGANNNLKNVTFGQALIGDESTASFAWLFETFKTCMDGKQPHVILTDEDPAMKIAIGLVFKESIHRNCRWHITRTWEYELDQLYTQHKKKQLKQRFESLINYPLGPTQFEVEWHNLIDDCGIADHPAIVALWQKRKSWIPAYFKDIYCGRMTSTQRSESQNRVLKDGYVNGNTSLHMFAKRMLDSLQHADHMDASETHYAQAAVVRASKAKFDEQLSRVYTRAVYKEYKEQYNKSTAFIIEPNPEVENGYLVKHETGEGSFCWAQHHFKVVADIAAGEYSCECKQWEHTGLFCMHIIKAFTHLQVRRILEKYILKRYSRDAVSEVPWDRHDNVRIGQRAGKEQTRLSKLLPKLMKLGRAGSRSDRAYDETCRLVDQITPGIEMFPRERDDDSAAADPSASTVMASEPSELGPCKQKQPAAENTADVTNSDSPPSSDPTSTLLHEGIVLHEPPLSRTKGRKRATTGQKTKDVAAPQQEGNPCSTYDKENYGNRQCRICLVRGTHYSTTCPLNPKRSRAAEERQKKKADKTQVGPPTKRARGRPKITRDVHEESAQIVQDEAVGGSQESSVGTRGTRGRGRGRGRGADTRNMGVRATHVGYQD